MPRKTVMYRCGSGYCPKSSFSRSRVTGIVWCVEVSDGHGEGDRSTRYVVATLRHAQGSQEGVLKHLSHQAVHAGAGQPLEQTLGRCGIGLWGLQLLV